MRTSNPIDRYVDWMQVKGLSPRLVGKRNCLLRGAEHIMDVRLAHARPADITALIREYRRRGLADSTMYLYAGHLSAFYGWAMSIGLCRRNPVRGAAVPRRPRYLPRPIGQESLLLAFATAEPRARVILALASMAGLRAVEIARLTREDVLEQGDRPQLYVRGKGNRDRVLDLSPELLAELRRYGLPRRGPLIRRLDDVASNVSAWLVSQVANQHLHSLGIDDTLHSLRHYAGSTLYQETKDIRLVQDVLGHASVATTALYAAWNRDASPEAMRRLAARIVDVGVVGTVLDGALAAVGSLPQ